jgi:hypothetical protein
MDSTPTLLNITKDIFSIIKDILALVAVFLTALWAYTKYVVERGILPPVHFFINSDKLGIVNNQIVLNIHLHLKNMGSSTLVARNIRLDLRYILKDDKNHPIKLLQDHRAGKLEFPYSLIKDKLKIDPKSLIPEKIRKNDEKLYDWRNPDHQERGFLVLEHDTFVQPGVDQVFTFVTMLPGDTLYYLTWGSFEYAQKPTRIQEVIYNFSRRLGLIQYSLAHVREPHTVEDVFWLSKNDQLEK